MSLSFEEQYYNYTIKSEDSSSWNFGYIENNLESLPQTYTTIMDPVYPSYSLSPPTSGSHYEHFNQCLPVQEQVAQSQEPIYIPTSLPCLSYNQINNMFGQDFLIDNSLEDYYYHSNELTSGSLSPPLGYCESEYLRAPQTKMVLMRNPNPQHSGPQEDRPFACDQCPRAFSRNHDLTRHKKIHSGIRKFSCDTCSKRFYRKDLWRRHCQTKKCKAL